MDTRQSDVQGTLTRLHHVLDMLAVRIVTAGDRETTERVRVSWNVANEHLLAAFRFLSQAQDTVESPTGFNFVCTHCSAQYENHQPYCTGMAEYVFCNGSDCRSYHLNGTTPFGRGKNCRGETVPVVLRPCDGQLLRTDREVVTA